MKTLAAAVTVAVLAFLWLASGADAREPRPDPDPSAQPGPIAWWKDDVLTYVPGVDPAGRVVPGSWFECRETWWDRRRCVDIGPPDVWVAIRIGRTL